MIDENLNNQDTVNNDLGVVTSRYIDKADAYLDANFNTQGGSRRLREFGNKQAQQLAKIYCDAYEQALIDNNL